VCTSRVKQSFHQLLLGVSPFPESCGEFWHLNRKSSKTIRIGGRNNNFRAAFTAKKCQEAVSLYCFLAGYPLSQLLAIRIVNLHSHTLNEFLEILSSNQFIVSFKHGERINSISVMFEHKLAKKLIVVRTVLVNLGGCWFGLFCRNNSSFSVLSSDSTSDASTDLVKSYFSILAGVSYNLLTPDYTRLVADQAKIFYLFTEDMVETQLKIL
jgi:hypothetical protein